LRNLKPILLLLGVLLAGGAQAWEEPAHWARIGPVRQWMELDARFYRTFDDNRFIDRSQFRLEQQQYYAETIPYRGDLPPVSLAEFFDLPADIREERVKLAGKKLAYVERFLNRILTQVQRARENLPSGWGDQISDVTVLGDCLSNLSDAVGLDPSNPYAWHLQSYFSMCAGDHERSRQYLEGATEALRRVPVGQLTEIRRRVALDLAWIHRGEGRFARALPLVQDAELMAGASIESTLLRGLIAAQTGDRETAGALAARLRNVEIRRFPSNLRSADFKPEIFDPTSWNKMPSSYLAGWITALSLLRDGEREAAASAFGGYATNNFYPLAWRFWNEAGLIYEMTGRNSQALEAWNTARIHRPWLRFMVYRPYDLALGVLTGHAGRTPYMLAYDRFFIAGSRLAYGASLVGKVGAAETPQEKQEWASRALDQLEICQQTGIYPGQASVLQGHVYYLLGDIESSLSELEQAVGFLERQGDDQIQQAVMKDMAAILQNKQAGEMQEFFRQSGSSRGRWEPDTDPAAREAELSARLKAEPDSDEAVLDMARFLIRHDRPRDGRALILGLDGHQDSVAAVTLLLEADRLAGDPELSVALVKKLEAGQADHLADAGLWSLVGSVCLETGLEKEARLAWRHALDLDPQNQGLRMQLRLMGD
jgi:tetratricopeptide (TPR) repeat protein